MITEYEAKMLATMRAVLDLQQQVVDRARPVPGELVELVQAPQGPCRISAYVRLGDDSFDLTVEGPTPEAVVAMYAEAVK